MSKNKINTECPSCEDFAVCRIAGECYYPTDREILAAKASEVVASAIRVAPKLEGVGEKVSVSFLSEDLLVLRYTVKSSGKVIKSLWVDLGQDDASPRLDEMLGLFSERFGE